MAAGAAMLWLAACGTPGTAAGAGADPDTGAPAGAGPAPQANPAARDVGHNLALLDQYCWRIELNKNNDYTVLAKASEGGISDATIYVTGASWAEVFQKAVDELEADMAAHGITPEEAKAHNHGQSFSEAQMKVLRDRYNLIDAKAWYFKAVKTQGWTMTSKADIGGISSVTAMGEGQTLLEALDVSLRNLDEEIARRKK